MPDDILTPAQKAEIADAVAKIPALEAEIARAKAAKIPVEIFESQLADLKDKLTALHQVYVLGGKSSTRRV